RHTAGEARGGRDAVHHHGHHRPRAAPVTMGEVRTMLGNERGLTLAEILVAVAIIGLGLVGLAVVIPVSSYGVQEGNQLSTATFLAEQMIERARSAQWTQNPAVDCLGIGTAAAPVPPESVDSTNTVVSATCNGVTTTQLPDETTSGAGVSGDSPFTRTAGGTRRAPLPRARASATH